MKVRNNNPLDLAGDDGERITVAVSSSGTAHLVNCVLDGDHSSMTAGQPLTFRLDKSRRDPTILTMLFTFSNSAGGAYRVVVTGSSGRDFSHFSLVQTFGIPGDSITYTIDVV